mmetsp:Transcript_28164/g.51981  ORF Transcript_28164/g.51981 Transcript_28164/m.51981 type:complete len:129 (-) Transcript_28164:46-432(-)
MARGSISMKIYDTSSGINHRYSEIGIRYHDVEPTDTLHSICSKYNVSATALRRANFSLTGSNVQRGLKKLIIPNSSTIQLKQRDQNEYPSIGDMFVEEVCLVQNHDVQLREATIKPLPTMFEVKRLEY